MHQALQLPDPIKSAISLYVNQLSEAFSGGLTSIYVYGSLARGCYNPSESDVDIIAVIRDGCSMPNDSLILQIHENTGTSMDVVVVTESQLNTDVFPSPVVYIVKAVQYGGIVRKPEGDYCFILQRQDAYEAGFSLLGSLPQQLINPVPWPLIEQALDYLFPYIISHFKNPLLMLSRILYAWSNRKLCGKQEAGEWAISTLDKQWQPMLQNALSEYTNGLKANATLEQKQAFEQYCASLIAELRKSSS